MLEMLRGQLAELRKAEERGIEERSDYPNAPTRAEEIADLEGKIRAYERLAALTEK